MPSRAAAWLRGLDPPIYIVGAVPVLVGIAATLQTPTPLPLSSAFLVLLAFLMIHAAVNVFNDAFDASTPADRVKHHSLARLASVPSLYAAAAILLAAGCAIGIYLWLQVGGWVVFALSAAGVALVFLYHAPPFRWSHHGLGEVVTFFGFGPLPVWTTAALADGALPRSAIAPGILVGLGAVLVLYYHNLSNRKADARGGKRTLAVALGPDMAGSFGRVLTVATALMVALWIYNPLLSIDALLLLFLLGHATHAATSADWKPRLMVFTLYLTIGGFVLVGLLVMAPLSF